MYKYFAKTCSIIVSVFMLIQAHSLLAQSTDKADIHLTQVETIDAIVTALYDIVSTSPEKRDWKKFKALFLNDARMISIIEEKDETSKFYNRSIDEYIKVVKEKLSDKVYTEIEIGRTFEQYNNIAQVFSTYESTLIGDDIQSQNGINSIQLLYHENRWWIANVVWNNEAIENMIPDKYKNKKF
jgi:hypothetical protein